MTARSLRKGLLLRLGVITIPVDLHTAVDKESSPRPKKVCANDHDPTPIKTSLVCPTCENDDRDSFLKGFEVKDEDGGKSFTLVAPDALTEAVAVADEVKNTLTLTLHPADQVEANTIASGPGYYVTPAPGTEPVYALIHRIAQRDDLALVCEFAVRSVSALYRLTTYGDTVVLQPVAWPENVRTSPVTGVEADEDSVEQIIGLLLSGVTDFDPASYRDTRAEVVARLVEDGGVVTPQQVDTKPKAGSLDDVLAALQQVAS